MRRLFISDLHLGDRRSTEMRQGHAHPFGWMRERLPLLEVFLASLRRDAGLDEVVILGDLFDQWVIPADLAPLCQIDAVVGNRANRQVIGQLKALAAAGRPRLTYLPGNHDMCVGCGEDIPLREYLQGIFPGLHYLGGQGGSAAVYRAGGLAAEHGSAYCLFNAPDTWTGAECRLPLGYFIARLVAAKAAKTGRQENYLDVLGNLLRELLAKPDFAEDLLYAVADDAGIGRQGWYDTTGLPGYGSRTAVTAIGARFAHLMRDWDKNHGDVRAMAALVFDTGDLAAAAAKVYFAKPGTNIAIFGHTHVYAMKMRRGSQTSSQGGPGAKPATAIYANSGAWTDPTRVCTYVETEEDPAANRHYVRIKSYPEGNLLHEGFVPLS